MSALAKVSAPSDYKALVCIFLSGGNDANNMVVPLDAAGYQSYAAVRARAGLAIAQGALLPVTPPSFGRPFGLHPSLTDLQTLFVQRKLALVSNVGSLVQPITRDQYLSGAVATPQSLFSHSDQVAQWETSRADIQTQVGWGGTLADHTAFLNGTSGFPMVSSVAGNTVFAQGLASRPLALTPGTPLNQVLVLNGFSGAPEDIGRKSTMDFLRTLDRQITFIRTVSDSAQQALDIAQSLNVDPTLTTVFPDSDLGSQLLQVAKVIKLNQTAPALSLNRQIFFCSTGGFDTHQDQIASQADLFTQVSQAMKAFYDATVELGIAARVTTFTLSDFGRTFEPSGSGASVGTDHGWGSHAWVMGGSVVGGEFYGVPGSNGTVFPTLLLSGPDDTDERGRWIPTTAIEQYAGTLATWFGLRPADVPVVFPLIGRFARPNLGFMG
jgi:uncharacterized protein (DUF1501 family)